jgi:hypothetical protein
LHIKVGDQTTGRKEVKSAKAYIDLLIQNTYFQLARCDVVEEN